MCTYQRTFWADCHHTTSHRVKKCISDWHAAMAVAHFGSIGNQCFDLEWVPDQHRDFRCPDCVDRFLAAEREQLGIEQVPVENAIERRRRLGCTVM